MIWCVEDDAGIREIETYTLQSTGFQARGFEDGAAFQAALRTQRPELIILDVMLPGKDGVTLLRELKADPALRDIPVIMATAKGAEYDKIQSLDLGADDYLAKPFAIPELLARVETVLRRYHKSEGILKVFDITIDTASRLVMREGKQIALTLKEFDLLLLLARNRNIALYRETIYESVWGGEYEGQSRTIDLHVQRLKKKLGWNEEITAVYKVGYRLEGET